MEEGRRSRSPPRRRSLSPRRSRSRSPRQAAAGNGKRWYGFRCKSTRG